MSDPEILDSDAAGSSDTASGDVERLVQQVQRGLQAGAGPGRALRVDVESRPHGGARFHLEADGPGGTLVVESGPLGTTLVSFGGARFPFVLASDPAVVLEQIGERVRQIAAEEIVVLEEQATGRLKRTTVLAVKDGRIEAVLDSGLEPSTSALPPETGAGPRLSSFGGTWNRAPSREEARRINRLTGGLVGRLKRKVAEKLLERAAGMVMGAVERAAGAGQEEARATAARDVTPDDGRRKLGD